MGETWEQIPQKRESWEQIRGRLGNKLSRQGEPGHGFLSGLILGPNINV